MKKILIFYASYGGGHLSAANAIREYISLNYTDTEIEMIDCMKYINKIFEKLTTTAYKEIAKKAPWAWGKMYYTAKKTHICKISSTSSNIMSIKLNRLLKRYNPDLIISTHPFSSQMCSYLKKKGKIDSVLATILTDYAPHEQWLIGSEYIDYFFVAHNIMKDLLVEKGVDSSKIYSTGIPLSNRFLLNYNKTKVLDNFALDNNKKTILFFGGGEFGLGKSNTFDILESFVKNFNNIQMIAISGKNPKMKKVFENIVNKNHQENNVKILDYTNQVPELMSVSDLVITKPGGLTTTESLASGLPIIVINPIPGQEEENAEFLEEHNVGIWFKKGMNFEEIILDLFNNPNKIQQMKINARLLAKKNSTKDICNILLNKK